eukprot:12921435-Prorocentrum_lima.AAC.1
MQPKLRTPYSTWDVLNCVKIMTGEVRVRAQEEDVETRMRPTLTNRFTVTNVAANQMTSTPTAAGVEGVSKKLCPRFATDQRCPLEEDVSMNILRTVPGSASSEVVSTICHENVQDLAQWKAASP